MCAMGCRDVLGIHEAVRIDGSPGDIAPDADQQLCYGTGLERVCLNDAPSGDLHITSGRIRDSDCMMYRSSTVPVCLIAANQITIGDSDTSVTTTLPLVLVADTTIAINKNLDVS